MAYGIFLPQRWRRQPQRPVQVDWGNSLTQNLSFAVSGGGGSVWPPDVVSQSFPQSQGTNVSLSASTVGTALKFSNGGNLDWSSNLKPLEGASKLTVDSLIFFPDNGGGSDYSLFGQWSSSLSALAWLYFRRGNRFAFAWGNNPADQNAVAAWESNIDQGGIANGKWVHVAFVWDRAAGRYDFYFDGKSPGASNNWFGTVPASIASPAVPVRLGVSLWTGSIATIRTWKRALSAAEIATLAGNPWQLFRLVRPIIYSFPSGAIVPALSSATVTDIGTTTARPRVTVTF